MKNVGNRAVRIERVLFSIAVCACVLVCNSGLVFAWKPTTHVYLAERALEDALDNGKVTIERWIRRQERSPELSANMRSMRRCLMH
ncbi:MAG: hypothetical protein IPK98_18920 [Chloracidobacterium sp.]|nr:hypothetical protein [Chloracidobacterium sp.]